MLNRDHGTLQTHEFTVIVELEEGRITPEQVVNKLSDALAWVEGAGQIDVASNGKLEPSEPGV